MSDLYNIVAGNVKAMKKIAAKAKPLLVTAAVAVPACFTSCTPINTVSYSGPTGGQIGSVPSYVVRTSEKLPGGGSRTTTVRGGGREDAEVALAWARVAKTEAQKQVLISRENRQIVNDGFRNAERGVKTVDKFVDTIFKIGNNGRKVR